MTSPIAPAAALAHIDPTHIDQLSDAELLAAAFDLTYWIRPDQRVPRGTWRSFGLIAGRGYGKTLGIGAEINRRVASGELHPPSAANDGIAIMAPTIERVRDVQVKTLIETSPPWCRAEPYYDGVVWPNGVRALPFTPEQPGRTRSGNFELCWLTELVDWQPSTRVEAHSNITTATRVGPNPQILWDSTSRGKNEIILARLAAHEAEPSVHLVRRGTLFDNPALGDQYIRDTVREYGQGTRQYDEEVLGLVFTEAAGALWRQEWIDNHRRDAAPALDVVIVSLDPAISVHDSSDDSGIVVLGRDHGGHINLLEDCSGRHTPEQWAATVLEWCGRTAAGAVIERNRGGDDLTAVLRAHAMLRGWRVEMVPDGAPMPRRFPGVVYVREVLARNAKESRASAPSVLYARGLVHHVGTFPRLELELTTWEPGTRRSPNRLDALAQGVAELASLGASPPPPIDTQGARAAAAELARRLSAGRSRSDRRGGGRFGI